MAGYDDPVSPMAELTNEIRRMNENIERLFSVAPGAWATLSGAIMNIGEIVSNNTDAVNKNTEMVDEMVEELMSEDVVELAEPHGDVDADDEDDYLPTVVHDTENTDYDEEEDREDFRGVLELIIETEEDEFHG